MKFAFWQKNEKKKFLMLVFDNQTKKNKFVVLFFDCCKNARITLICLDHKIVVYFTGQNLLSNKNLY